MTPGRVFLFSLSIAAAALPAGARQRGDPARADTVAADSVRWLAAIEVEASRVLAGSRPGVAGWVVDPFSISYGDLVSALTDAGAVFVQDSGTGTASFLRLRGTDAGQATIELDGMPLRDPVTGSARLDLVPRAAVGGMRVDLGPAAGSASSGPGLGGTVSLATPSECTSTRLDLGAGAFGERRAGGAAGRRVGNLCVFGAAEAGRTDGDFAVNPAPGGPSRRLGNDRRHKSGLASIRGGTWSLLALGSWSEQGLPGPANSTPRGVRNGTSSLRIGAAVRRSMGEFVVAPRASVTWLASRLEDPLPGRSTRSFARALAAGIDVLGPSFERWFVGGSAFVESGRFGVRAPTTWTVRIVADRPARRAHVGLSVGVVATPRLFGVPTLSVRATPGSGGSIELRASVGRSVRVPGLADRFWVPGGNPDLAAESGWGGDVGFRWAIPGGPSVDVGAFAHAVRDRIVWLPRLVSSGLDVWSPANFSRVETRGVEVRSEWTRYVGPSRVQVRAAATWSRSVDRSDPGAASYGHPVRLLPGLVTVASVALSVYQVSARVVSRLIGRRPTTTDGALFLPAAFTTDLGAGIDMGHGWAAAVMLVNLGGARYETLPGYPLPGRHLSITLKLDLQES